MRPAAEVYVMFTIQEVPGFPDFSMKKILAATFILFRIALDNRIKIYAVLKIKVIDLVNGARITRSGIT